MKLIKRLALFSVLLVVLLAVAFFVVSALQESKIMGAEVRKDAPGDFISLTHGETHYIQSGPQNGPKLLFIHGGGITGSKVWESNFEYFVNEGYNVLAYDLYGRGYSDRLTSEYTPELLQEQLEGLTTTLGFKDSLTIVSMSMGSMVALDYAIAHTTQIQKMVMLDPAITGEYRANPLLQLPIVSDLLMTFYWYPRARENQRKEFVNQSLFDTYAIDLKYFMEFEGYKHVNYSTWMHTLNQDKLQLLSQLPNNQLLLIYGANDPYFPAANAEKFKALYASLKVKEVANAGHMPHLEKPLEVNNLILDFLQTTPE
ncbi:MAG: alpha/beta hydrolase [Cyclobacteriaceae bacterium]